MPNTKKAIKWYNALLDSGDLTEMFPLLKGYWEEDKIDFLQHYEAINIDILHIHEDINQFEEDDY